MADQPPPSSGPEAWTIAAASSARFASPAMPWRRRVLLGLSVLLTVAVVSFAIVTALRVPEDKSADVVLGEVHVGFHGLELAKQWVCAEGHQHLSAPYWSGIVLLGGAAALSWWGWKAAR